VRRGDLEHIRERFLHDQRTLRMSVRNHSYRRGREQAMRGRMDAATVTKDRPRPLGEVLDELISLVDEDATGTVVGCDLRGLEPVLALEHDGSRYVLLRQTAGPERRRVTLSGRELEITRMIARGHTNRTIAAVLDISPWTVSTHLRRVFAKLEVCSRAAMVAKLVAQGHLDEPR
jgi:DNA-binding CsgD family transcriptional regulator